MQAPCPNCQHTIRIDDAKVPDRAFSVKCPKCQTVVKFPGKAAAAAPAAAPAPAPAPLPAPPPPVVAAPPPAPAPEPPAPAAGIDEMRAQMMAQLRREMGGAAPPTGNAGRALVALPDRGQAGNITLVLTRLGYGVETLDDWEEGGRLMEQGVFALVATTRQQAVQGKESLYQRVNRLQPEARRALFVVLVGDEYKSGDGTQGFAVFADLVVASKDAGSCDTILRNALAERQRMYQAFNEAKRRFEHG